MAVHTAADSVGVVVSDFATGVILLGSGTLCC